MGYLDGVGYSLRRAGILRRSGPGFFAALAIGTGIGIVAGAVCALLMTPRTGREMRNELGYRAKQLANRTQAAVNDAKEKLPFVKREAEAKLESLKNQQSIP